jgi:hypothetical protein
MISNPSKTGHPPKFPIEYPLKQSLIIYAKRWGILLGIVLFNFLGLALFLIASKILTLINISDISKRDYSGFIFLLDRNLIYAPLIITMLLLISLVFVLIAPDRQR